MPGFVKAYPAPALAAEALRRTEAARAQGVPTPAAAPGPGPCALRFQRIEGASGQALLTAPAAELLAPLVPLHRAHVPGLPRFDPLLRVRPRLGLTRHPAMLAALQTPVPGGSATLHGDFHVGQLIAAPGGMQIVDLDDLATGPPEADLANFTAHLATTGDVAGFAARLAAWRARICGAWADLGTPADPGRYALFLRLALLRRHLKLRAAGRPDFEVGIAAVLSGATARTSPSGSAAYPG